MADSTVTQKIKLEVSVPMETFGDSSVPPLFLQIRSLLIKVKISLLIKFGCVSLHLFQLSRKCISVLDFRFFFFSSFLLFLLPNQAFVVKIILRLVHLKRWVVLSCLLRYCKTLFVLFFFKLIPHTEK